MRKLIVRLNVHLNYAIPYMYISITNLSVCDTEVILFLNYLKDFLLHEEKKQVTKNLVFKDFQGAKVLRPKSLNHFKTNFKPIYLTNIASKSIRQNHLHVRVMRNQHKNCISHSMTVKISLILISISNHSNQILSII